MRSVRTRIPRLTASCMGMILPRALGFDFCFGLGACSSLFLEAHKRVDHDVGVGEHVVDGGRCGVHAVLADGGQDFVGDPALEGFGLRLA